MEHKGTKIIETERLILRQFTADDAEAVYRNWTSDDKVTEFLRWPTHDSIKTTENVLLGWIESYDKPDFYQWAIELKELGEPIGTISVVDKNENVGSVHIGYCIGSKWWHQGITSEAFAAIIPYLFEEVGANRIESMHDPFNKYSGDVMKKCGMKFEGRLRKADYSNKGIVDAKMYSLLREEWESRKIPRKKVSLSIAIMCKCRKKKMLEARVAEKPAYEKWAAVEELIAETEKAEDIAENVVDEPVCEAEQAEETVVDTLIEEAEQAEETVADELIEEAEQAEETVIDELIDEAEEAEKTVVDTLIGEAVEKKKKAKVIIVDADDVFAPESEE